MRRRIKVQEDIGRGTKVFFRRLMRLFRQPIFVFLTVLGHGVLFGGAAALYYLESDFNPTIQSPLDTLYWAVSTVSTVGAADVRPMTSAGKLVAMATMILGCLLFWSYTALFAGALVAPELRDVELEVRALEGTVEKMEKELKR